MSTNFSNFGSLKSTETWTDRRGTRGRDDFSNFGSLKSTETRQIAVGLPQALRFQQFRLVEEH